MYQINLDNTKPNQKFNVDTEAGTLIIELRTVDDITLATISAPENNIVSSVRVVPETLIIGYKFLQDRYGDLMFTTTNQEYPYYTNFNSSNKLIWLSPLEVQERRNGNK